jgi:hypothetical protein
VHEYFVQDDWRVSARTTLNAGELLHAIDRERGQHFSERRVGGNARGGRQRKPLEQPARHGIDARVGHGVAGEGVTNDRSIRGTACRRWIVDGRDAAGDGLGEGTLALQHRGHRRDAHAIDRLPGALVVAEEEGSAADDRPAQDGAGWWRRNRGFSPEGANALRAFNASWRTNAKADP